MNWLASSLSETLSTDIGQSQRVRLVSPSRLQQVLRDLHISPMSKLDMSSLKRIAEFTNADTIVYGQYEKFGDQIRINATVYDLKHDRNFEMKADVPSEKDLLKGLDSLADQVRANLSSDPDVLERPERTATVRLDAVGAGTARSTTKDCSCRVRERNRTPSSSSNRPSRTTPILPLPIRGWHCLITGLDLTTRPSRNRAMR